VNDNDYHVPFAFNGKIDKLTVKLGPMQLTEADQKKVREAFIRGRD
jgi:arylsulfatase